MRYLMFTLLFLCSHAFGQSRWNPYAGVCVSMDAGGYFVGPSFLAGTDYRLKNKISVSSYVQYFSARLNDTYLDGTVEKGKYKSLIAAILLQSQLSKNDNKGFRGGIGIAFHTTKTHSEINYDTTTTKRNIFTAAFRLGYYFPLGRKTMVVELDAVGPYKYSEGTPPYQTDVTELLTQLSLGIKYIF
jgi:hypothetical protein